MATRKRICCVIYGSTPIYGITALEQIGYALGYGQIQRRALKFNKLKALFPLLPKYIKVFLYQEPKRTRNKISVANKMMIIDEQYRNKPVPQEHIAYNVVEIQDGPPINGLNNGIQGREILPEAYIEHDEEVEIIEDEARVD